MKQILFAFTLCLFSGSILFAQNPGIISPEIEVVQNELPELLPVTLAKTITSADMTKHLNILASDEFEGRETGTPGNQKAADYIAEQFKNMGLPPVGENESYFQNVIFTWTMWDDIGMYVNDQKYRHKKDFVSFPEQNSNRTSFEANEIVFLGYGIDDPKYSDYKGVNVKDKTILIYKDEPTKKDGTSRITGTHEVSEWSSNWTKKMEAAHKHGVKNVLIIDHEIQKLISESLKFLIGPKITLGKMNTPSDLYANSLYISTNIAKEIMGDQFKKVVKARKKIQKKGNPKNVTLPCNLKLIQVKNERKLIGNNVLGYIEGSDEQLKEELVVVTAHYDHLGKQGNSIYNGADDNGSGTTTVIEVAEAFAEAKKQGKGAKRSVLVMLVTGEEKGLLGSKYYTEKPLFPLENTVVDINVDMVGRVDEKYKDNPNYIYVIGSDRLSSELHEINETVNKNYTQLVLDYTYNAKDDPNRYYYRSDHYNFAEKGIPSIFYFNGTHKDYHRPSDTVDKINFEKMEKIGRLVFHTAWEIANREKRIEVDVMDGK